MGDRRQDADIVSSISDQTLENQNEEELQSLHGKIKALRSVCSHAYIQHIFLQAFPVYHMLRERLAWRVNPVLME